MTTLTKHISILKLSYTNPAKDMDSSLEYDEDVHLDIKKTIDNLINKLQESVKKLQDFKNEISDGKLLDIEIDKKTNSIYIHGPKEILVPLEDKQILIPDTYIDDEIITKKKIKNKTKKQVIDETD